MRLRCVDPKFNAVVQEVIKERGIATNDLYQLVLPHAKEWQGADQIHFGPKGNEEMARRVSESILKALEAR